MKSNESVITTKVSDLGKFSVQISCDADISAASARKIDAWFQNELSRLGVSLAQVEQFTPDEIILRDGQHLKTSCSFLPLLEKVHIEFPDSSLLDRPLPPISHPEHGTSTFSFVDDPFPTDSLCYSPKPSTPSSLPTRQQLIRDETRAMIEAMGKRYDPKKKVVKESLQGVSLSIDPRNHYRGVYQPTKEIQNYFGKDQITLTQRLAWNSPLIGASYVDEDGAVKTVSRAINSSFNRATTQVPLMRALEDGDGDVLCFMGRSDKNGVENKYSQAKGQISFLFNTLLHKGKIQPNADGTYDLPFLVQSLMHNRLGDPQTAQFQREVQIYQELAGKTLSIADAANPQRIHQVRLAPVIPVASNQFDASSRFEAILPQAISGEAIARRAALSADAVLFDLAEKKMTQSSPETAQAIADTVALLKEAHGGRYEMWQELTLRAYLAHLLDIPQIVHCKSSVDRTSVFISLLATMKMRLKSPLPLPRDSQGRIAIFKIFEESIDTPQGKVYPCKEHYAFALHLCAKTTEHARGVKGFKFFNHWLQLPAVQNLLPERYFVQGTQWLKYQALNVVSLLIAAVSLGLWCISLVVDFLTPGVQSKTRFHHLPRIVPGFFLNRIVDQSLPWTSKENKLVFTDA
jgi:hypothetical protein